jgi:hypothetical protein
MDYKPFLRDMVSKALKEAPAFPVELQKTKSVLQIREVSCPCM